MSDIVDILVEGVSKTFKSKNGNTLALENVSLSINRSQIFCIVGPSGCGKSTLLKILLGLCDYDSGIVKIDEKRKNNTAYIQQNPLLLPWRTVLQNAALGAEIKGNFNEDTAERIIGRLKDIGLEGCENKFPPELSGGMKQRVSILSAIDSQPNLLFCDEPFSAIDFVSRLDLNMKFKNRCAIGKMTTIFVTHNIEEAIFLGDVVAVMSGSPGKIINTYPIDLKECKFDAIGARELPDFHYLFKAIWNDLKSHYEH